MDQRLKSLFLLGLAGFCCGSHGNAPLAAQVCLPHPTTASPFFSIRKSKTAWETDEGMRDVHNTKIKPFPA